MNRVLKQLVLLMYLATCLAPASAQAKKMEYWEPIEPYRIWVDLGSGSKNPSIRLGCNWRRPEHYSQILRQALTRKAVIAAISCVGHLKKGFIYVYHSEGLSIIDFSYGKVTVTSEGVVFNPEREMKETFWGEKLKTPHKWIPISVEGQVFFVAEDKIKDFGDYEAGLGVYNDFNGPCCEFSPFFTKNEAPTSGKLSPAIVVPLTYKQFIRHPVKAEIISVAKKKLVFLASSCWH
jgi:hypothetical protein